MDCWETVQVGTTPPILPRWLQTEFLRMLFDINKFDPFGSVWYSFVVEAEPMFELGVGTSMNIMKALTVLSTYMETMWL